MRFPNRWTVGDWTFYEVEDHGFTGEMEGRNLYAFGDGSTVQNGSRAGQPKFGELYTSLDRAIIAAVGEKYTGPRGAGGTGVGTAADWFARMIGMDSLVAVDYSKGQEAVREILHDTETETQRWKRARVMTDELGKRGLVIAAMNHG